MNKKSKTIRNFRIFKFFMIDEAEEDPKIFCRNYFAVLILGLLNDLPYWISWASSRSICNRFQESGLFEFATRVSVLFSVIGTTTNAFLTSYNVSYNARAIFSGFLMLSGLLITAFASSFLLAIVGITIAGFASDFGESVMLGYFSFLDDPSLLSAWGLGMGMCGITGCLYYFATQIYEIPYMYSFIALTPISLVIPATFIIALGPTLKKPTITPIVSRSHSIPLLTRFLESQDLVSSSLSSVYNIPKRDVRVFDKRLWKSAAKFFYNINIGTFCQNVNLLALSSCAITSKLRHDSPHVFSMFMLCYQAGHLLGKSSLQFYAMKHMIILPIFFVSELILLYINAGAKFINQWGIGSLMFLLGIAGGLSYINCYYRLMNSKDYTMREREIMTNFTSLSISISVDLASGFIFLLQNVMLAQYCS